MLSTLNKRFRALVISGSIGAFACPLAASASNGTRLHVNLGPWVSNFTQSDGTREVKLTSAVSGAAQFQFGIDASLFFAEYSATWLASAYSANPKARDASYFSPLGANVGVSLPLLPLEFYVGGEKGTYKLNGGANPGYSGLAMKGGVNFVFRAPGAPNASIGLKAEFRRFFGTGDDAGALPSGLKTRADTFFVGMTFGRR